MTVLSLNTKQKYGSLLAGNAFYNPSDYQSIATVTVGAGGSSVLSFSSISSSYTHLQLRCLLRASRNDTADGVILQYNGDTGSNYSWHYVRGDGASAGAGAATTQTYMAIQDSMVGQTGGTSLFGSLVIDILDYANANRYKTQKSIGGNDRNGAGYADFSSGYWRSNSAITSIDIKPLYGSGFAQYSQVGLYGVKA